MADWPSFERTSSCRIVRLLPSSMWTVGRSQVRTFTVPRPTTTRTIGASPMSMSRASANAAAGVATATSATARLNQGPKRAGRRSNTLTA